MEDLVKDLVLGQDERGDLKLMTREQWLWNQQAIQDREEMARRMRREQQYLTFLATMDPRGFVKIKLV